MFSLKYFFFIFSFFIFTGVFSQDISLFRQFNGHYDYTAFGNTLNTEENGAGGECTILTGSSADFQLQPNQEVIAAYLYWAGSGPGDFNVTFNQMPITAARTFVEIYNNNGIDYIYFSAFADVTQQIKSTGNGNYTLSDLDLTLIIPAYCSPPGSGTNFGGWAVTVIYEDASLPSNQVNVFDGLESVSRNNQSLEITLNNLLVLDTVGAKIGFLAWEGDRGISVNETLRINGNILSNPPLNPADNAFNGTNSFTGSDVLYNMDIDVYPISNFINPGDTSATIQLTSGQDFVMVNNIITVLNTELPDATISIDTIIGGNECGNRELTIEYTVYNLNSTDVLPAGTPIALVAPTGSRARVTLPSGDTRDLAADAGVFAATEQPGIYRVEYVDGTGAVSPGKVAIRRFVAGESAGPSRDIAVAAGPGSLQDDAFLIREWAPWVIAIALVLMALEWWVAHHRPGIRRGRQVLA